MAFVSKARRLLLFISCVFFFFILGIELRALLGKHWAICSSSASFPHHPLPPVCRGGSWVFCFAGKISLHSPGWLEIHYVAQAGLKLVLLLPQPLKCWLPHLSIKGSIQVKTAGGTNGGHFCLSTLSSWFCPSGYLQCKSDSLHWSRDSMWLSLCSLLKRRDCVSDAPVLREVPFVLHSRAIFRASS